MINPKIGRAHLSRRAVVYLRQSTPHQVESNRESTSRQYALAERASELGWDKSLIQILDGQSLNWEKLPARELQPDHLKNGLSRFEMLIRLT